MGLEHLLLRERAADSIILAFDEERDPFRLTYRLAWDESWRVLDVELVVVTERGSESLSLCGNGQGLWRHRDGRWLTDSISSRTLTAVVSRLNLQWMKRASCWITRTCFYG